ncbi:MAG: hypothetical protein JXA46_19670 [Dehalococcoidales bacterium]|nr:hypothetical protein [Dehalococcoidales bacterium]
MFKVKATMIGFQGDTKKYPCHFNYHVGDEIIWTGAEYKGRICPALLTQLAQKVDGLYKAGPRYVESGYYLPFWYAPVSEYDPAYTKYDGIGFRPVLKTIVEPQYHMAHLRPANSFLWPPHSERTVSKGIFMQCGDLRTAATFKLEAFDIADDGDCVTYFRRMMVILARVSGRPGIPVDDILNLFTRKEIEEIYPSLSPIMVRMLVEELELVGHLEVKDDKATVTPKGEAKYKAFIAGLSAEEKEALSL